MEDLPPSTSDTTTDSSFPVPRIFTFKFDSQSVKLTPETENEICRRNVITGPKFGEDETLHFKMLSPTFKGLLIVRNERGELLSPTIRIGKNENEIFNAVTYWAGQVANLRSLSLDDTPKFLLSENVADSVLPDSDKIKLSFIKRNFRLQQYIRHYMQLPKVYSTDTLIECMRYEEYVHSAMLRNPRSQLIIYPAIELKSKNTNLSKIEMEQWIKTWKQVIKADSQMFAKSYGWFEQENSRQLTLIRFAPFKQVVYYLRPDADSKDEAYNIMVNSTVTPNMQTLFNDYLESMTVDRLQIDYNWMLQSPIKFCPLQYVNNLWNSLKMCLREPEKRRLQWIVALQNRLKEESIPLLDTFSLLASNPIYHSKVKLDSPEDRVAVFSEWSRLFYGMDKHFMVCNDDTRDLVAVVPLKQIIVMQVIDPKEKITISVQVALLACIPFHVDYAHLCVGDPVLIHMKDGVLPKLVVPNPSVLNVTV